MELKIRFKKMVLMLRSDRLLFGCLALLLLFNVYPCWATQTYGVFGKPLRISGFINQGVGYGIGGDHYDTKEGWQSFNYNVLLEADYRFNSKLRMYASGMLSGDWAFDILSDSSEWNKKGFSGARNNLSHDTVLRDLLQEAHVTWSPGNFLFRAGKQVVVWGEMDGFRLMDQINPLDERRGITDVEFESTVLPIWLLKAEYYIPLNSLWLQDLGLEFIFNPNADFEPNRPFAPGNDVFGIWAPNVTIPAGGPFPFDFFHLGSVDQLIDDPDDWDSDYFEYGFRLKSIIHNTIVTLNYFYGRDNDPILKNLPLPPEMEVTPYDGRFVVHPKQEGFYSRFRIAGATLTRDIGGLYVTSLGGVSPILRLEAFYGFDNTFSTTLAPGLDDFETHDEIRYAVGIDWKIKVKWLNPRAYFLISPQFYHRHVLDYPSNYDLWSFRGKVEEDTFQTTLMIMTTYMHNKLEPSVFWLADHTIEGGFIRPQIEYEYSDKWNFTLGALFVYSTESGTALDGIENKDHIYFTIGYKY